MASAPAPTPASELTVLPDWQDTWAETWTEAWAEAWTEAWADALAANGGGVIVADLVWVRLDEQGHHSGVIVADLVWVRLDEQGHQRKWPDVSWEVIAMRRHRHLNVLVLNLQVITVQLNGMVQVARHPGAYFSMPTRDDIQEPMEVSAVLRIYGCRILFAILRIGAILLHLSVSNSRLSEIIEEDTIENTQIWKPLLPSTLHDYNVLMLECPRMQALQHNG